MKWVGWILLVALSALSALPAQADEGPSGFASEGAAGLTSSGLSFAASVPSDPNRTDALARAFAGSPFVGQDLDATAPDLDFAGIRPPARKGNLPRTRWQHKSGNALWTRAALSALSGHGQPLVDLVPADIHDWCPAYEDAGDAARRAFWVGFMSALAKYESTYKAHAVGGGGRWYGLLQILPATARGYDCLVGTGDALKSGAANLSCAVRIMAVTVPRDGVIYGRGGRGVAADWGPMRNANKRGDMAGWLKRQTYCAPLDATRPRPRP